jgi:cell division protein FtsB
MVGRLVKENRTLRAQNQRLAREADKLADGWEQIKKLARAAPRGRGRR